MKIVSQLPSTTPIASTKAAPSLDSGADFHGALTTATARSASSTGKAQGTEKQQTPENKKKSATSDSPTSDIAAPPVLTSKLPPENEAVQVAIAQTVNGDASGQASREALGFSDVAARTGRVAGASSSSPTSISYAIQLPANNESIDAGIGKAFDGKLEVAASSTKLSDLTSDDAKKQIASGSTVSPLDHSTSASLLAAATVAPGSTTQKNPPAETTGGSKAADTSNVASAVKPSDPTALAAQASAAIAQSAAPSSVPGPIPAPARTGDPVTGNPVSNANPASAGPQIPTAFVQSAALPVSLPSLSPASASPPSTTFTMGESTRLNKATGTTKGSASPQIGSASKSKPTAPSSDVRGKAADDKSAETQRVSSPAAGTSLLANPDTSGNVNHAATESRGALNAVAFQQTPQSTSTDGSTKNTQALQGPSAPGEAVLQAAPAQLPSDNQAMQGISSAQLTQSMRSSEMKLGMQSPEFGNISISTSLNHQAISAQISIDHSELGRALAVHLPAIEEKLGSAYGVQAKVELRESNNPSSNDSGYSNSGQQSREQRQSREGGYTASQGAMFERTAARTNFAVSSAVETTSRLDIRI